MSPKDEQQRPERVGRAKNARQHQTRETYTAFDRAMIRAKEQNKTVIFLMAEGSDFKAHVCSVDKYFIEVDESGLDGKVWISKAMIVYARIIES